MRKSSANLFTLIKSLSKSEKRDFILYASRYDSKKSKVYIGLFREINAQKIYDEKAITALYSGEKLNNYFYSAKAYLFNLILQSLRGKSGKLSPASQINTWLKDAEILTARGLYSDAGKILKKAEEKAAAIEADDMLLQVYRLQDELAAMNKFEPGPRALQRLLQDRARILARLNYTMEMERLIIEYEALKTTHGRLRKPEHTAAARSILKDALSRHKRPPGKRGEFIYLHLLSEYRFLQNNENAGVAALRRQVNMLRANKNIFARYSYAYFISQLNFVNRCVQAGFYTDALKTIEHLKAGEGIPAAIAPVINLYSNIFSLIISAHLGDDARSAALLEDLENNYHASKNVSRITDRIDTIFVCSWFNFMLGRYEKCLEWVNVPLTKKEVLMRENSFKLTRILNIMAHYELASYDTVHYILRNTRYYFNKKSALYKFEAALLEMFGRLIKADKSEAPEIFAFYKRKLKEISKSPFEQPLSGALFPLLFRWFDSKVRM